MSQPSKTARNLVLLTLASIVQIIVQFLIQAVLAYQYGTKADADALSAALALPTYLAAVVTGSLSYVLVPELVACFTQKASEQKGWQVAAFVGAATIAFGLICSAFLYGAAGFLVEIVGWGFSDGTRATAIRLLRILSVQVVLSGLISWAQAVHHSRHSFTTPALGGVLGTLLTLWLTWIRGQTTIDSVAWAINAGSIVSVAVHLFPLAKYVVWPQLDSVTARRLTYLMWPLIVGNLYLRIEPVIDRMVSSELYEGAVRQLDIAYRIVAALLLISTSGLSVIALPQLVDRLANNGTAAFVDHFALAVRRLVLIVTPILIGLSVFSTPVISDLLERGEFKASDSRAVGTLIVCLMGVFIGASLGELLSRGFYILGDTRTPTIVGAAALTMGIIAKLLLVRSHGILGIAVAATVTFVLSAAAMAFLLKQRTSIAIFQGVTKYALQASAASCGACAICYAAYYFDLGRTWVAAPIGATVYVMLLILLRNPDAIDLVAIFKHKIKQIMKLGNR